MFVYVIVCSETLKIYVGQHKGKNLRQYLQQKQSEARHRLAARSHLYAAMRKYSEETWSIHPLAVGVDNRAKLDELERHYVRVLKTQHPDVGYNICRGGEGFTGPQSESAKAKITAALIGHHVSAETRAKIGAANAITAKGQKHTPEHNAKMAAIMAGRHTSTGMLGRTHSPETLEKMRESAKRRGISSETRAKINAALGDPAREYHHPSYATPEGNAKNSAAKLGKPWSAARRAAYEQNKTFSSISEPS